MDRRAFLLAVPAVAVVAAYARPEPTPSVSLMSQRTIDPTPMHSEKLTWAAFNKALVPFYEAVPDQFERAPDGGSVLRSTRKSLTKRRPPR